MNASSVDTDPIMTGIVIQDLTQSRTEFANDIRKDREEQQIRLDQSETSTSKNAKANKYFKPSEFQKLEKSINKMDDGIEQEQIENSPKRQKSKVNRFEISDEIRQRAKLIKDQIEAEKQQEDSVDDLLNDLNMAQPADVADQELEYFQQSATVEKLMDPNERWRASQLNQLEKYVPSHKIHQGENAFTRSSQIDYDGRLDGVCSRSASVSSGVTPFKPIGYDRGHTRDLSYNGSEFELDHDTEEYHNGDKSLESSAAYAFEEEYLRAPQSVIYQKKQLSPYQEVDENMRPIESVQRLVDDKGRVYSNYQAGYNDIKEKRVTSVNLTDFLQDEQNFSDGLLGNKSGEAQIPLIYGLNQAVKGPEVEEIDYDNLIYEDGGDFFVPELKQIQKEIYQVPQNEALLYKKEKIIEKFKQQLKECTSDVQDYVKITNKEIILEQIDFNNKTEELFKTTKIDLNNLVEPVKLINMKEQHLKCAICLQEGQENLINILTKYFETNIINSVSDVKKCPKNIPKDLFYHIVDEHLDMFKKQEEPEEVTELSKFLALKQSLLKQRAKITDISSPQAFQKSAYDFGSVKTSCKKSFVDYSSIFKSKDQSAKNFQKQEWKYPGMNGSRYEDRLQQIQEQMALKGKM
ncbi:Conserved_hypothetical protein [Hexamita inflata]|uniref:Uncharacterized protein n=1 Tax=Hexamita inflata TaxID=28002 RepID=A0AA86P7S3_9EUKA|nr:Conserved hypothetical protein [Hexamita inflata]